VKGVELQVVGQRECVARHVGYLVRLVGLLRLPDVAVVEGDHPVVLRELRDLEHPAEVVGAEAHHQQQRLAFARFLVVETFSDRHAREANVAPCPSRSS
jgi:hypothetical protein